MNLSSSFSEILMNNNNNNSLTISHQRNASTSPKRIQLKDQIIQRITTLISLELNKIDSRDIETKLSLYFNLSENNEANTYIQSLCSKISEVKKNLNSKVKNFLNHNINALIENIKSENNNIIDNDLIMKNKYKLILKEMKAMNNNSRIKFKKLYDNLSNEYDKILSTVYDYLQKGNTKLVIDRLNRVEQLKNDVLFDVTSIENIQNKFTDSIKGIMNKINNDKINDNNNIKDESTKNISKNNFNSNSRYSLGRTKTGYFTSYKKNNKNNNIDYSITNSDNNLYSKLTRNKFEISNFSTYGNINNYNKDENECVKLYRIKIKEKKNEIEKLKQQLQQEKESKNKAINELNKLQYANQMALSIKNTQKNSTKEEKFNKLTEMIISFTYSMNNLRNSLYQKTISHIDAKNIYGKLKNKLISLVEETSSLKNSLSNNDNKKENSEEDLNEDNEENNSDIKTIKEENENSQIFTDRDKDYNKTNDNINNNYNNNQQTGGNIVNNNITLNTLPNYNMQVLLEENKNLREQLSQAKNNNPENISNNNDQDKNLIESLKKQIIDLKKIIKEKDKEIENKNANTIKSEKDELKNIIINNTKNIEQLKTTYQLLIDGKDNRIKELEEEIIVYEKEIDELKEENDKLKAECRKDKILSEAEVNNLKNQKIELQCLLEQGGSNNSLINLNNKEDKEKIKKMENEINIKNKQIILLTQNHENDLKELNLAIEMLKHKIIQLEEENNNLSSVNNKENEIINEKNE